MIGILGGMGTQAGLDFCNKLAVLNRGKIDQEYPLFILYNKSNIPGRPESIGVQTKNLSNKSSDNKSKKKYNNVLKSLPHIHQGYEEFYVIDGELQDADGKIFKKGDFITYEPNSIHSSHTEKGCLILTFMRGQNYQIKK